MDNRLLIYANGFFKRAINQDVANYYFTGAARKGQLDVMELMRPFINSKIIPEVAVKVAGNIADGELAVEIMNYLFNINPDVNPTRILRSRIENIDGIYKPLIKMLLDMGAKPISDDLYLMWSNKEPEVFGWFLDLIPPSNYEIPAKNIIYYSNSLAGGNSDMSIECLHKMIAHGLQITNNILIPALFRPYIMRVLVKAKGFAIDDYVLSKLFNCFGYKYTETLIIVLPFLTKEQKDNGLSVSAINDMDDRVKILLDHGADAKVVFHNYHTDNKDIINMLMAGGWGGTPSVKEKSSDIPATRATTTTKPEQKKKPTYAPEFDLPFVK